MYPLDMIPHIVDSAKNPITALPFANDAGIVLGLVSRKILLAGEAAARRLRAALVPAEERLGVAFVVLPQITAARENRPRRAARVGAGPGAALVEIAVCSEVRRVRRQGPRIADPRPVVLLAALIRSY